MQKEVLINILKAIVFSTVVLNGVLHATQTPFLFINDLHNPVMTIWTSTSFLIILLTFNPQRQIKIFASLALAILQIPSMIQLPAPAPWISHPFFYPSSSMTVMYMLMIAGYTYLGTKRTFISKCLTFYFYFIASFIPIFGVWGLLFEKVALLSQRSDFPAVGFSIPTIALSTAVLIINSFVHVKEDYDYLRVKAFFYSFKFFYIQVIASSAFAIPLIKTFAWPPVESILSSFLLSNLLFMFFARNWIEKKALEEKVTVCSWKNTIKSDLEGSENWVHVAEYLNEKGYLVSHGISPEAVEERRAAVIKRRNEKLTQ